MASRGETLWLSANGCQTCVDVTDFLYLFNLDSCPKLQNDNFERINNGKKTRGVYRFRLYLACVASPSDLLIMSILITTLIPEAEEIEILKMRYF